MNRHSHRERLEITLAGEKPDHTAVALWRHFPIDDLTPEGLASSIVNFERTYEFDLVKVTPASSFSVYDWGVTDEWTGFTDGNREIKKPKINNPDDWAKLNPLDPNKGCLGRQLEALHLICNELGCEIPVIQTIFSPLATAKHLCGSDNLILHMRTDADSLHAGLRIITESIIHFIDEAKNSGMAGIFYALQHAQVALLSNDEFHTFCRPYDLQILETTKDLWLNMIHIHGENIRFDEVADYPVSVFNWHDQHTSPSMGEALKKVNATVCGGLRRWETMALGTPDLVEKEARQAIEETGNRRFILGTGCVLPILTPHSNILAARNSALTWGR